MDLVPISLIRFRSIGLICFDSLDAPQLKRIRQINKTEMAIAIAKCVKKITGMEGWGKCNTEDFEAVFAQAKSMAGAIQWENVSQVPAHTRRTIIRAADHPKVAWVFEED